MEFSSEGATREIGPPIQIPESLVNFEPETTELLRTNFQSYWRKQRSRIARERFKVLDNPQSAFEREVDFFTKVVANVNKSVEDNHGGPTVVLFDVDEAIGRVADTNSPIKIDGLTGRPMSELTPEENERLASLYMTDEYKRFYLRPALAVTVNYLKEIHGENVQFGILSTKAQEGLDLFLTQKLESECPGKFDRNLIMSSKDGPAINALIPEVLAKIEEADEAGEPITFEQALSVFSSRTGEQSANVGFDLNTIVPERIINMDLIGSVNQHGEVQRYGVYDSKLFMMMRLLERYRQEGAIAMQAGVTTEPPEVTLMLFDDAVQELALGRDQSLQIHKLERFRLPDDYH